MRLSRYIVLPALGIVAATAACRETVHLDAPSAFAGTYALESTTGRYAPITGTFVLTAAGQAERHVRYSVGAQEYVNAGTFALRADNAIDFALQQQCGDANCVWNVRGTRTEGGDRFTIEYPDPADGPPITETYRRQ